VSTVSKQRRLAPSSIAVAVAWALLAQAACAQGIAELYDAALRGNPTLRARSFDVDRARAEADAVRSRLLPLVAAQAGVSSNEYRDAATDESYGGKRASLTARQSLYDPVSRQRLESARASIGQREQELAQVRLALFAELFDRYLQALAAQDELASLAAESQAATRQLERLQAMRERQMARVPDLAEAQAYVLSLVTRTIDAGNQQAIALARLGELSGLTVRQVPALTRTTFDPVAGTSQEWAAHATRGNQRLLALAQAVEAARRNLEASRAERLPQVAATLARTYSDQGFDNRRQPPYHATSLGIEMRVPLYEGGRADAAVRDATARLGGAEQQLEAARREVEREVLAQWLSAQANHARIGSTDAEVLAFEQAVQAQERGLELGASRITDLLDARRRLLQARADQAKARYGYVRDVVALKIRSGELSDADIAAWDRWFGPLSSPSR
jgi:outer membrane protein